MMPNVPYFPAIYFGILRAGGIVVPMNVLLKKREVGFYLEDPGTKLLFAWRTSPRRLRRAPPMRERRPSREAGRLREAASPSRSRSATVPRRPATTPP
jgi:acyl-CoA synthetase (AMP-forming)/AMP-acid ligase II